MLCYVMLQENTYLHKGVHGMHASSSSPCKELGLKLCGIYSAWKTFALRVTVIITVLYVISYSWQLFPLN
jgi:hypothetical protein